MMAMLTAVVSRKRNEEDDDRLMGLPVWHDLDRNCKW